MAVHTASPQFVCPYECRKAYRWKEGLLSHTCPHNKVPTQASTCRFCNKTFTSKHGFDNHEQARAKCIGCSEVLQSIKVDNLLKHQAACESELDVALTGRTSKILHCRFSWWCSYATIRIPELDEHEPRHLECKICEEILPVPRAGYDVQRRHAKTCPNAVFVRAIGDEPEETGGRKRSRKT